MDLDQYAQIKLSIKKLFNINLDHYKDEQMRRRLDSWLVRSGAASWSEYLKYVQTDQKEQTRFRDYLTINVSAFFRDPERWQALRQNIIPELVRTSLQLKPSNPGLQIWSAGCSIGAEPYTLAIMLDEIGPARNHHILATDFDRGALAKCKARGPYTADEIQNLSKAQRATYLDNGGPPYFVKESLTKKIDFREHDLLSSPFPTDYDLIICRNVVIYFTSETKEVLYRRFYDALRPGGILFVGATEIIPHPQAIGFHSHGISFYRKGI